MRACARTLHNPWPIRGPGEAHASRLKHTLHFYPSAHNELAEQPLAEFQSVACSGAQTAVLFDLQYSPLRTKTQTMQDPERSTPYTHALLNPVSLPGPE